MEISNAIKFLVTRCFEKKEHHSLDNFQPIMELFQVPVDECMDQCIQAMGNNHFVNPKVYANVIEN
jgi:hypothetical protein